MEQGDWQTRLLAETFRVSEQFVLCNRESFLSLLKESMILVPRICRRPMDEEALFSQQRSNLDGGTRRSVSRVKTRIVKQRKMLHRFDRDLSKAAPLVTFRRKKWPSQLTRAEVTAPKQRRQVSSMLLGSLPVLPGVRARLPSANVRTSHFGF